MTPHIHTYIHIGVGRTLSTWQHIDSHIHIYIMDRENPIHLGTCWPAYTYILWVKRTLSTWEHNLSPYTYILWVGRTPSTWEHVDPLYIHIMGREDPIHLGICWPPCTYILHIGRRTPSIWEHVDPVYIHTRDRTLPPRNMLSLMGNMLVPSGGNRFYQNSKL
jgi:hypothetical protein